MDIKEMSCIDCGITKCNSGCGQYPAFCPTPEMDQKFIDEALDAYNDENYKEVMLAAAATECEHYCEYTRVQEVMDFAERIGAKKLGIATCVGLIRESRTLAKILRNHGFEVVGITCKAGAVDKRQVGITCDREGLSQNMCNPILQAKYLNAQKTDLNLVVGLCVGHDSLFYRHSDALCTTVVTKDRVLGHNPVAALYTAESYYAGKLFEK